MEMVDTNKPHGAGPATKPAGTADTLGARLRMKRKEMGWTQEQLAVKAGTTQAVIQKIENGKSLRPRKIEKIAEPLGVLPAWLMFGDDMHNDLDREALEVARAWSSLPEADRLVIRQQILTKSKPQ